MTKNTPGMKVPTCPRCRAESPAGWQNCPQCGTALTTPKRLPWGKAIGWSIMLSLFAACSVAVASSSSSSDSTYSSRTVSRDVPKTHTVTYKVGGSTNQASITYSNAYGDTSQQSDIDVPLTRKSDGGEGLVLHGMEEGDFLYISAQNSNRFGSVTCTIEIDGIVVKTNTSHGGFTIATCSGRL